MGLVLLGVILFVVLLSLVISPFLPKEPDPPDTSFGPFIFFAIIVYGLLFIWRHAARFRRAWKKSPHLTLPHTLTADDTGLTEQWPSSTVQTAWSNVTRWLETPNTLAIATNLGLFILPKSQLPQPDLQLLLTLLQTHSPHPTHAFPVGQTPSSALHE